MGTAASPAASQRAASRVCHVIHTLILPLCTPQISCCSRGRTHSCPPTEKRSEAIGSPSPMPLIRLYPTIVCVCSPTTRFACGCSGYTPACIKRGGPLLGPLLQAPVGARGGFDALHAPVRVSVTVLLVVFAFAGLAAASAMASALESAQGRPLGAAKPG